MCIEITSIYPEVYEFCRHYIVDRGAVDISLTICQSDLVAEAGLNHEAWPASQERVGYLEILAVYRKIAEAVVSRDVFLVHGTVISVGGAGIVFAAPSGTGKTTQALLWTRHIPDCHVVNGDKPLLRVGTDGVIAFGTPWCGKECMGRNEQVPLRVICYVQRSAENRLVRVHTADVWPLLLKQVYLPKEAEKLQRTILLFNQLCAYVPVYRLECNMSPDAALVAHRVLMTDGVLSPA